MAESDQAGHRGNAWLDRLVRWMLLVLVLGGFVLAVGDRWSGVRTSVSAVSPWTLLAAWFVASIGLIGPWRAWDAVVSDMAEPLPPRASAQIFFVGQLGKYLPGAVWPVVVQMRLARAVRLSKTHVALSFVVTLILGMATGVMVGALAVPALAERTPNQTGWLLLVLVPVAGAALQPKILSRVTGGLQRLVRRPGTAEELSAHTMRRAVTGTCFFWVVGGLHLWLIVVALGGRAWPCLPVCIGALALAVSLGPLLVVLPAGAGVREAVLVAALASVLSVNDAVAAALLSRAVLVLGDGALAAVAFIAARGREPGVLTPSRPG